MTNVAPQWQEFNAGNWAAVENAVKQYVQTVKRGVYVFTGTGKLTTLRVSSFQYAFHFCIYAYSKYYAIDLFTNFCSLIFARSLNSVHCSLFIFAHLLPISNLHLNDVIVSQILNSTWHIIEAKSLRFLFRENIDCKYKYCEFSHIF